MNIPALILALLPLLAEEAQPAQGQQNPTPQTEPPKVGDSTSAPPKQVSGDPGGGLLGRSTSTYSFLSGEDLRTLGVRSYTDALRLMPGLEVEKISATESAVSLRGYVGPSSASQGMMLLMDGRQAYNEFLAAPLWENLPVTLDEIKSIKVIRGPASFEYGPNAMHGIVIVKTKSPLDYARGEYAQHQIFGSISAGSYGSNVQSLTYVRREENTGVKVTLGHDDMNQFETHDDTKNKLFGTIQFETIPLPGHDLDVTAGMSQQIFGTLFPQTSSLPPVTYSTDSKEYFILGKYSMEGLTLQASWSRFSGDAIPDSFFAPFNLLQDTGDVELQFKITVLDSHHLIFGTGIRYSTFVTSDLDVADGRHATTAKWLFVQDEIALFQNLFLTVGARLDNHSVTGTNVSPRFALVYVLDQNMDKEPLQSLRASLGYGLRNPGGREIWFNMPVTISPGVTVPSAVQGNPDLNPEKLRSVEFGYWGRPTEKVRAECSIYYNRADSLFVFAPTTGAPLPIARTNRNHEDAYGVETSMEYQLNDEVFLFGNYTYALRHDLSDHNRIPDGPLNKANVGVRYVQTKGLGAMMWANFFDEITFTDKETGDHVGHVPAYGLLNAKVWYPFKMGSAEGNVFVQAFNATNHVHREHPNGDEYGAIAMAGMELAW
jgi:iron complex outermembrane receptor protein